MTRKFTFHPSYTYNDGDIILRTSDDVCFRVHSIILKLASGFFRQMFDIPRAANESQNDAIPLTEESSVLSCLLDLVYPTNGGSGSGDADGSARLPSLSSLPFAWAVSTAADKYDMPRALAAIRSIVMTSGTFRTQPLALYALASHWKWTEETRAVSRATLNFPLLRSENFPILRSMDSDGLCDLLQLHATRKEAILKCFDLKYRDNDDFIVYQWECKCSPEADGTKTESFLKLWDAMRSFVIASLEASPLGRELQEPAFWSRRDLKLWTFTCHNCGKLILNKAYFIQRVAEVFQDANFPSSV